MNRRLTPGRAIYTAVVLATVLVTAAVAIAAEPQVVSLIGKDLSTWRGDTGDWAIAGKLTVNPDDRRRLVAAEGTGVAFNGPTGKTRDLLSKHEHGDVQAHVEFMVPKGSNSGVYFQGRYEIQILDSWGVPREKLKFGDCGGIYAGPNTKGHPPRSNASRAPGRWQTFEVVFRALCFDAAGRKIAHARFVKVVHNGKVVHENVEVTGPTTSAAFDDEKPTGPLMLQGDHGPVAYRNIRLRPIRQDK